MHLHQFKIELYPKANFRKTVKDACIKIECMEICCYYAVKLANCLTQ